jgi:hypothetical protein
MSAFRVVDADLRLARSAVQAPIADAVMPRSSTTRQTSYLSTISRSCVRGDRKGRGAKSGSGGQIRSQLAQLVAAQTVEKLSGCSL